MQRLLIFSFSAAVLAAVMSEPAQADCTCRAQGRNFEQGQLACLTTPNGPRIATCGMVLNNSAWEFSQSPCIYSQPLQQPQPVVAHGHGTNDKS